LSTMEAPMVLGTESKRPSRPWIPRWTHDLSNMRGTIGKRVALAVGSYASPWGDNQSALDSDSFVDRDAIKRLVQPSGTTSRKPFSSRPERTIVATRKIPSSLTATAIDHALMKRHDRLCCPGRVCTSSLMASRSTSCHCQCRRLSPHGLA